ncbi:MAG: hypothetical protein CR984_02555 [Proteobacteria bacterium]|nr:MAG: hypothetical protein CR984_02555 [Pseudomonadota bacterium]
MAYFKTRDGCSLYYETVGVDITRPLVIFFNGTLQTTMYWKLIAKSLQPAFRCLLYDARGQGESELGDLPLSLDLHVADAMNLIGHLDPGRVHLVGLSHGALLACALANQRPRTVNRLLLCSFGIRTSLRSRLIVRSWQTILQKGGLEAMVTAAMPHVFGERYLNEHAKHLDRVVKTIVRRNRKDSVAAHLSAMGAYPGRRSILRRMNRPSLVLCGADDPLVNIHGAIELAEMIGGRHRVIEDAGHSIPAEVPREFIRIMSRFLSDRWTDMPEAI